MFMVKLVLVVLVLIVIMTALEMGIRRVFKIGKRDKKRPRYINKLHSRGEITLLVTMIVSFGIFSSQFPESKWVSVWFIIFFIILELFRVVVEWKYAGEKREYILHIFWALSLMAFLFIAMNTNWLQRLLDV